MKKLLRTLVVLGILFCGMAGMTAFASADEALNNLAPSGLSVAEDVLYITDSYTNQIYSYDGETLTLLAGNANYIDDKPAGGYLDGLAEYTLFNSPYTAIAWNGGVLVSDTKNHVLRFIQDGVVETYAGTGAQAGYVDGAVAESAFYLPSGLALDADGTVYVADTGNGVIRAISTSGEVSTYASDFSAPSGLYWYQDVLYVTDIETNQIFSVEDGVVSLVAGQGIYQEEEWIAGYQDGTVEEAMFSLPQAIYVDEMGIYVGDTGNNVVRKIASGEVTTLYTSEDLLDPTALVKYQGELLIGDALVKKVSTFTDTSDTILVPVEETEANLEIAESPAVQVTSQTTVYWVIAAVIVILAAILAVVLVYRKKHSADATEV